MSEEKSEHRHHEHHHKSDEEKSITIKKSDLWKYSTFVLIVIGSIFLFTGKSGTTPNSGTGNAANVDASIFEKNPSLFPSLGPDDASAVVVEFADFQCPYCALASGFPSWSSQYVSQYGDLIDSAGKAEDLAKQGQIKFIYVPLSFLGQESVNAAQAGYCAQEQGKFWEMHDEIFKASDGPSENTGKYSIDNLKKIAQGISGMDTTKFNSCLDSGKYASAVQQATALVQNAGFQISTPQFWVNGNQVSASWSSIEAAISSY